MNCKHDWLPINEIVVQCTICDASKLATVPDVGARQTKEAHSPKDHEH